MDPTKAARALLIAFFTNLVDSSPPTDKPKIGERQAASLLCRALKERIIDAPCHKVKNMIRQLGGKNSKRDAYLNYLSWRLKNRMNFSTHLELSDFLVYRYSDVFSRIIGWNLVGQEDEPVLLVMKDNGKPLFPGEEERLESSVQVVFQKIEYFYKDDSSKALGNNKDTLNGYIHTFDLHPENQENRFLTQDMTTKIWASQKIISLVKGFFLDGKSNFESKLDRIGEVIWGGKTDLKWLTRELARVYYCMIDPEYHHTPVYYRDRELEELFQSEGSVLGIEIPSIFGNGKMENDTEIRKFLEVLLIELISKAIPKMEKVDILTSIDCSLFSIPPVLLEEWKKSPNHPTLSFAEEWIKNYGLEEIGQYFVSILEGIESLSQFPNLKEKMMLFPQRSKEWLDFYKSNSSDKNNSFRKIEDGMTFEQILEARYNLVGGNIVETWVTGYIRDNLDLEIPGNLGVNGELAQTGIVQLINPSERNKTIFCSPDGLVIQNQKIVPIEIKAIMGTPCMSSSFLRDYDLARLQLRNTANIINDGCIEPIVEKGFGFFLFIFPEDQKRSAWNYHLYRVEYDLL
jgi:hypothetical protein